jgi:hypothetical protein
MINFTEKFFDLRLLKIADIKLHETTETKRMRRIFDRIAASKYLMNPVIVGLHKGEYILIDGANRLSSLEEIGCKLAIAQIIDYSNPKIKLRTWNHLIYNTSLEVFLDYFDSAKIKYKEVKISRAETALKSGINHIAISDISTGKTYLATLPKQFDKIVKTVNSITKLYFNVFPFDRSEEEIKLSDVIRYTRKNGVILQFPRFKKQDVITASKSKNKIPAGITRHLLINRVLHVRYEINKLRSDKDIPEKTAELQKYLISKIDNNKVRQYRESVIVFDE